MPAYAQLVIHSQSSCNHPDFKNLIFALSMSCALCSKFISENIKDLAAEEVERDKRRKMEEDPNWIPRNWENLWDEVQNRGNKGNTYS